MPISKRIRLYIYLALLPFTAGACADTSLPIWTKGQVDSYFALETKFKENVPADRQIKGVGFLYRVPYSVVTHNNDLRRREKLAAVGP